MTIGQLCFYDQIKQTLLASGLFGDNLVTHFTSSLGAVEILFFSWNIKTLFSKWLNNFSQAAIATTMTQPLDVLKTRSMNAKPGFFWVVFISNSSPQALFAFILTFYFSLSLFLRRVRQLSRRVQDDIERGTDGVLQGLHPGLCSPRSPDHPHLHLLWATQNELRILPRTKMNKSSALTMTSGCANEI